MIEFLIVIITTVLIVLILTKLKVKYNNKSRDHSIYHVGEITQDGIVNLYLKIQKLRHNNIKPVLYLASQGGAPRTAMIFYDLMHTSGAYNDTTIIATGSIDSAGNILLLSAKNRLALPSASFLWHELKVNYGSDREKDTLNKHSLKTTATAVERVLGTKVSLKWIQYLNNEIPADRLNTKEALEIGLIQGVLPYK